MTDDGFLGGGDRSTVRSIKSVERDLGGVESATSRDAGRLERVEELDLEADEVAIDGGALAGLLGGGGLFGGRGGAISKPPSADHVNPSLD